MVYSYVVVHLNTVSFPPLQTIVQSATEAGQAPLSAAGLARQTPSLGGCAQCSLHFVVTM